MPDRLANVGQRHELFLAFLSCGALVTAGGNLYYLQQKCLR